MNLKYCTPSRVLTALAFGAAGLTMGCAGTGSAPERVSYGDPVTDTCSRFAGTAADDETIVVMRDQSSRAAAATAVAEGPDVLEGNAVLAGPVVATPEATAGGYRRSRTWVEMKPCPPDTARNTMDQ